MKTNKKSFWTNVKLVIAIVPTVILLLFIFFVLTRREIITLSKDNLAIKSKNYADDISEWADCVLGELNIYSGMIEHMSLDDPKTLEMLKTSANSNDAYPYGLYWGDDQGTYFDSSGWVPDADYVVTERNWYLEGLEHERFSFGEPYMDAMTGDTCVSVTTRVKNYKTVCVLAADVYLDYASDLVSEITKESIEHALYATGGTRIIVADSDTDMVGKCLRDDNGSRLYANINQLLEEEKTGQSEIEGDDGLYYVDINRIENTDWYFITCMSRKGTLKNLDRLERLMLLAAVIVSFILVYIVNRIAREMSSIRIKAKTDPLTRLLNRDGFREMMMLALETNSEQGILMIMDMDNFKNINDQLGHPEGDAVLKRFAVLLESYFNRNKDIVARIGGDEFAVYVGRPVGASEVEAMLKKFILLFHGEFDEAYPEQKLSVSIGGAFTADNKTFDKLYKSSDEALYKVKRNGKDGFMIVSGYKEKTAVEAGKKNKD